jgi:hypothetical protein
MARACPQDEFRDVTIRVSLHWETEGCYLSQLSVSVQSFPTRFPPNQKAICRYFLEPSHVPVSMSGLAWRERFLLATFLVPQANIVAISAQGTPSGPMRIRRPFACSRRFDTPHVPSCRGFLLSPRNAGGSVQHSLRQARAA